MAMPNIPDRDKQILAKVITGAIGNLGKAFVQGFGNADTAATGSIEVEPTYRDWETDRKSTRLNSSHRSLSRMPSSA